jgi:Fe-S cluster biosynthesis and repair protein YggX
MARARLVAQDFDTGARMSRTVFCSKHQVEAEGLDFAPWPGDAGQRVFDHIGKPAWNEWLAHQTMLINEHRLMPRDPKARAFLQAEMEKFLFGEGAEKPAGYVPE